MTASPEILPHPDCLAPAAIHWQQGIPVSTVYEDVYFSRQDGIAESLAVFLHGNDLPGRWQSPVPFTIAELGFGSGLNFALTRQRFLQTAPADSCLQFVSFERHPLTAADQRRMATLIGARAPGLGAFLQHWAEALPPRLRGWHHRSFDGDRVRLSLYYGDVSDGLADWDGQQHARQVDAWYLDGFAPGRNPQMWQPELFRQLAGLSHGATTLASFSVAALVRHGLEAAGFELQRAPGPLGKRQVLRGRMRQPPNPLLRQRPRRVAVIGAGLAGACTAHACARRGLAVDLYDRDGPAGAASANPWAVLHPRLPLDTGKRGPWLATAYHHSLAWLRQRPGWRPHSVLQLPEVRRPERLGKVLARFGPSGDWLRSAELGPLHCLAFAGGHADLPRLITSLLQHPQIRFRPHAVTELSTAFTEAYDAVIVATGSAADLLPDWLPLRRMRGQLDQLHGTRPPSRDLPVLTGRGHAIPLGDGWVAGASYERNGGTGAATAAETAANLQRLQHLLGCLREGGRPAPAASMSAASFVGVRAHLPDRWPAVGRLTGSNVWLNCGHGSSGLLSCPLSAEVVAASLFDDMPVLDRETLTALAPERYAPARG